MTNQPALWIGTFCLSLVAATAPLAAVQDPASEEAAQTAASASAVGAVAAGTVLGRTPETAAPPEPAPGASRPSTAARPDDGRPPIRPVRAPGLTAEIAALLLGGQEGGSIPMQILALPVRTTGGTLEVPVVVELDAAILFADAPGTDTGADTGTETLVDAEAGRAAERLDVYAYALGEDGTSVKDSLIQAFEFDVGRFDAGLRSIQFVAQLELPGDAGLVKVLVRHPRTGAVATRSLPIHESGTTGSLRPLVLEPRDAWIPLRQMQAEGGRAPLPTVFEAGVPAAQPVVTLGEPLRLRVLARPPSSPPGEPADAGSASPPGADVSWRLPESEVMVELSSIDGRKVAEQSASVVGRRPAGAGGQYWLDVEVDTTYFPQGRFDLRVMLPGAGSGDIAVDTAIDGAARLPVLIADPGVTQGDPWPALEQRLAQSSPRGPTSRSVSPRSTSEVDPAPVLAALGEVFDLAAAGRDPEARRRLWQLASELEQQHGSEGMKALGRTQLRIVRMRAERSADAVIPLISLNLGLYREARDQGRSLVSSYARQLVVRLVDLYIELAGNSPAARETAATVLVSLGGELQASNMIYFSEGLFRRALALDPSQRAARLALGMTYQIGGDQARAVDTFGELIDRDANDAEALLRLAVLRLQDGSSREAARLFGRVVEIETAPPWVASLAFQELARLRLDAGEVDEATALLERAVARLPREPRLRYLLAFVHRAANRPEQAAAVAAEIGPWASRSISPRQRFAEWPQEAFVAANSELQRKTIESRALLASRSAGAGVGR